MIAVFIFIIFCCRKNSNPPNTSDHAYYNHSRDVTNRDTGTREAIAESEPAEYDEINNEYKSSLTSDHLNPYEVLTGVDFSSNNVTYANIQEPDSNDVSATVYTTLRR